MNYKQFLAENRNFNVRIPLSGHQLNGSTSFLSLNSEDFLKPLKCLICRNIFNNPVIVSPCLHRFCLECYYKTNDMSGYDVCILCKYHGNNGDESTNNEANDGNGNGKHKSQRKRRKTATAKVRIIADDTMRAILNATTRILLLFIRKRMTVLLEMY
jgi:hypothetical protein